MSNAPMIARLLDVIEHDIVPLTQNGVAAGNKVFGAAVLRKADLSLVLAETNNETENPLWHGEMHCLKRFYEMPADQRGDVGDLVFLSTHEPCSMCLSAITWAGFDNFAYLFSHEDSRNSFAIPHDLRILAEVFRLPPGGYANENAFWQATGIKQAVAGLTSPEREALSARVDKVSAIYAGLSQEYQAGKDANAIPLA